MDENSEVALRAAAWQFLAKENEVNSMGQAAMRAITEGSTNQASRWVALGALMANSVRGQSNKDAAITLLALVFVATEILAKDSQSPIGRPWGHA